MKGNLKLLLIGYRATGKSSTGRMLADRTGVEFMDTDRLIEEREGKTVSSIVSEQGWSGFRTIEKEVLKQVVHAPGKAIIACGGGAVLHGDVFDHLSENVHTVWLAASTNTICSRITGDSESDTLRPSLKAGSSLRQEVTDILAERRPLYRKYSGFMLDTDNLGHEDTVRALEKIWDKINGI